MHPNVPGVPWWGAVLIAVTATAIGFAFDAGAGTKELTHAFAALYMIGCVAAVLAVRQAGLFTAVVQPPVVLFISVPGAYFLFHGAEIKGIKDILINCGYPLIERFPLMLFTSAIALVIGLVRWYIGHSSRIAVNTDAEADTAAGAGLFGVIAEKVSSLFGSSSEEEEDTGKRRHAIDRAATPGKAKAKAKATSSSARPARRSKTAAAAKATRSRHARPPVTDVTELIEPVRDRPRRSRSAAQRQDPPPEHRRRRPPAPREGSRAGRDPYERRDAYEGRAPHDRRSRYDSYDLFAGYEPPQRRRPGATGTNGSNGTHHPISNVRYRGSRATESGRPDAPARHRSRSWEAETWEYDI
jgi:hypothetical protein